MDSTLVSRGVLARWFGVAVAALFLVLLAPAPASHAHAFLSSSTPGDGAVVGAAPRELQLAFSESVELSATHVEIVDSAGHRLRPRFLALGGEAADPGQERDTEDPMVVRVGLPTLRPDAYRVSWETLSSDDLHRTKGVIVFGVQRQVQAAGQHEPDPGAGESSVRWVVFLGMAAALGGGLFARLSRRQGPDGEPLARRGEIAALTGACAAAVAAAVLLLVQMRGGGSDAGRLLTGRYGVRWAVRESGLVALALLAWHAQHGWHGWRWRRSAGGRPGRLATGVTVAAALAATTGSALLGHAAAGARISPSRVAADSLHLLAAGTWSGMLVLALAIAVPPLRRGDESAEACRSLLRSFGVVAAACVATMAVTGIYLSSGVVGSVDAALLTIDGRVLLRKVALVAVALVLGLVNHRRLRGRRGALRATLVAEAIAAIGVLAFAAVLTSAQPANEPQYVRQAGQAVVPLMDKRVADLQQTLAVRPNRPGANVVLLDVFDTRRPAPAPIRDVLVSVTGPGIAAGTPARAVALGDGEWSLPTSFATSAPVRVTVTVRRAGMSDVTTSYRWNVGGGTATSIRTVVSTTPIEQPLQWAAAAIGGALVAGGGVLWWRRRRQVASYAENSAGNQPSESAETAEYDRNLVTSSTNARQ